MELTFAIDDTVFVVHNCVRILDGARVDCAPGIGTITREAPGGGWIVQSADRSSSGAPLWVMAAKSSDLVPLRDVALV